MYSFLTPDTICNRDQYHLLPVTMPVLTSVCCGEPALNLVFPCTHFVSTRNHLKTEPQFECNFCPLGSGQMNPGGTGTDYDVKHEASQAASFKLAVCWEVSV